MADSASAVVPRISKDVLEDLELSIFMERLRLLQCQRELAALHCQRFTEMLEASLSASHHASDDDGVHSPASLPSPRSLNRKSRSLSQQRSHSGRQRRHRRRAATVSCDAYYV